MSNAYKQRELTPALSNELEAVLAQSKEDGNLNLAIDSVLLASRTKAAVASDTEIAAEVEKMDADRARAELVVMIKSYQTLIRASFVLLLAAADGRILSRKSVGRKAAEAANREKKEAKAEAKKLWQERREGKHPSLRTNDQFSIEVLRRWPVITSLGSVKNWCTEWNREVKKSLS